MYGFTGLDPEQALADLNNFDEKIMEIYNYGNDQFTQYNEGLLDAWYSPAAKEHSHEILQFFWVGDALMELRDAVLRSARSAIKIMAKQNNIDFEYDYPSHGYAYNHISLNESGPYGVGMNKVTVGMLVANLESAAKKMINDMESLPTNLAVYDNTNQLEEAYKNLITSKVAIVQTNIEQTINKINELAQTERDRLDIGVNNAAQELAG